MKKLLVSMAIILTAVSCRQNPFLTEWNTPYGIPPFDEIKTEDYLPAIQEGISQQQLEIDAIVKNGEDATFENTVAALDASGKLLGKVTAVLFNLSETDGTDQLQAVVEQVIPLLSEHSSNIYMNPLLFERVQKVYADANIDTELSSELNKEQLNSEQMMLLNKVYRSFVNNGIALSEKDQARMREINTRLSVLEQKFGTNLLAENNAFAAEFGVTISEYVSEMTSCSDRDRREKLFKAYSSRGNNGNEYDNKVVITEIMSLRQEKARMLSYDCPANFILSDKMAANAETVNDFLQSIFTPAVKMAKEEIKEMQKVMDKDIAEGILPQGTKIQAWDWFYYTEKVRKEKFNLDESLVRPYFKMENVRKGVFETASKLYGLVIEPIENAPVYHPDVEVFKVSSAQDGSLLGILTTDYYPRSTKRGGAWMGNIREQYINEDGTEVRPIIVNVGNFAKPTEDTPSLLTIDQVGTMFHEFGHALHGLLSQCHYVSVSGTSVARDFVELPSQINENWAFLPEVLATYAFHYETGEIIPSELVEKIQASSNFNQGFMTTELAAASILDMKWHELQTMEGIDIIDFESKVCKEMGLIDEIIPRYRTTYFNHIFNSGYSAGYYSYLWAEVLDKDAFELFKAKGVFDKETAMAFKKYILEAGASDEPMKLYEKFRGASPDPKALLRARGLI